MNRGARLFAANIAIAALASLASIVPHIPEPLVVMASGLRQPQVRPLPSGGRTESTEQLRSSQEWGLEVHKMDFGNCLLPSPDFPTSPGVLIGHWNSAQQEVLGDCKNDFAWQARVVFNLDPLKNRPGIQLHSADLQFAEARQDDTGGPQPSCVGNVRIASSDQPGENDFYQEFDDELPHTGTGRWDVLRAVDVWRSDAEPNFGLVFHGLDEEFDFNNAACASLISDFKILVAFSWDKPDGPDLNVTDLKIADKSGGAECSSGQVNVTATVRNDGDVASQPFNLVLRVNGDDSETMPMAALAPGASKTASFGTASLLLGPNKILVVADPGQDVKELDENNNLDSMLLACAQAGPRSDVPLERQVGGEKLGDLLKPVVAKSIDLQVGSVQLAGENKDNCSAAKSHTVMAELRNAGGATVDSVALRLLVDDATRASTNATGVGPQAPVNVYFDNVTLSKGKHALTVVADPGNAVSEGNEDNNKSRIDVTCK
jgi:hypothetical protein